MNFNFMKVQYKVRVNYKSGIQEEFWCKNFNINHGTWTWKSIDDNMKPIMINIDEVESVYQVGIRYRLW